MPNNKHLTLDDRNFIHTGLNTGLSFRQIALHLAKTLQQFQKKYVITECPYQRVLLDAPLTSAFTNFPALSVVYVMTPLAAEPFADAAKSATGYVLTFRRTLPYAFQGSLCL
jgi:hypothetical protein